MIPHDAFRDGHVPESCGNLRVLQKAVAQLPGSVQQSRVRRDSA